MYIFFSFSKEDEVERKRRERHERREKNQTEEEVVSLPAKGKGGSCFFFHSGPKSSSPSKLFYS